MEQQYAPCHCEACRTLSQSPEQREEKSLSLAETNAFSKVLQAGAAAFRKLFERQSYKPTDLFEVPEYKALMDVTKAAFDVGIKHHIPNSLKSYLDKDVFVFSGLKTHQQLADARSYLKDEKGNIRPYHEFEKRIQKLNPQYNKNYLDAEYSFAVQSAISASAWESFDGGEDYYLQYRTAGDERVRASHAALHNTTLPKEDEFWDSYMPPNGWRCRCRAIEVAAYNYAKTDSKTAIRAGEKATTKISKSGRNSLEMFRFNPGKAKRIFPKNNAYNPRHCDGGKVNLSGLIGHSQIVLALENERCQAKKIIEDKAGKLPSDKVIQSRNSVKEWVGKQDFPLKVKSEIDFINEYTLSKSSIKTMISKWHPEPEARNEWVKNIKKELPKATYHSWAEDEISDGKQKHQEVDYWIYLSTKINDKKNIVCVKKTVLGKFVPYSIEAYEEYKKIPHTKTENPKR